MFVFVQVVIITKWFAFSNSGLSFACPLVGFDGFARPRRLVMGSMVAGRLSDAC